MKKGSVGYTPKTIRDKNIQLLFQILRNHLNDGIPVRDLAFDTGLSKTAIKKILDQLMQAGVILCIGKGLSTETGGKRPDVYILNPNTAYTISIEITDYSYSLYLHNLAYHLIDSVCGINASQGISYTQIISNVISGIQKLLHSHLDIKERLVGIVIFSAGVISYNNGILVNPIPYPGWGKNLTVVHDIRSAIELDCPIYFDHTLVYHSYYQQTIMPDLKKKNVVTIYYHPDHVGGCIFRSGQPIHGPSGLSGEFGHFTTDSTFCEPCCCGRSGCFESIVRHQHIVNKATRELSLWPLSSLNGLTLNFKRISDAADAHDPFAMQQMDYLIRQFTILICNLQISCDFDLLILKCFTTKTALRYFQERLPASIQHFTLGLSSELKIEVLDQDYDIVRKETEAAPPFLGAAQFSFDLFFNDYERIRSVFNLP